MQENFRSYFFLISGRVRSHVQNAISVNAERKKNVIVVVIVEKENERE